MSRDGELPEALEACLREVMNLAGGLYPSLAGSYNRGHENGVKCAVDTIRDLYPRAIAGTYPFNRTFPYGEACRTPATRREGFVEVPREITNDMHVAAVKAIQRAHGNEDFPRRVWAAMLAAVEPPQ